MRGILQYQMHILARLRRDEPKIKPEMESDWINREGVVGVGKESSSWGSSVRKLDRSAPPERSNITREQHHRIGPFGSPL